MVWIFWGSTLKRPHFVATAARGPSGWLNWNRELTDISQVPHVQLRPTERIRCCNTVSRGRKTASHQSGHRKSIPQCIISPNVIFWRFGWTGEGGLYQGDVLGTVGAELRVDKDCTLVVSRWSIAIGSRCKATRIA